MLLQHCKVLGGFLALFVVGCATEPNAFDVREAEINAAYARGEITFVEKEQLQTKVGEERRQSGVATMQALKALQRPPQDAQWITPSDPDYDVYDTRGNRVGQMRSR